MADFIITMLKVSFINIFAGVIVFYFIVKITYFYENRKLELHESLRQSHIYKGVNFIEIDMEHFIDLKKELEPIKECIADIKYSFENINIIHDADSFVYVKAKNSKRSIRKYPKSRYVRIPKKTSAHIELAKSKNSPNVPIFDYMAGALAPDVTYSRFLATNCA
ncbi:hypothetical protein [Aeromonas jandaei]|uniref:hypothetical protein n=1 Tax=Aeromonas jandaei TaxID=650 RepID=UPI003A2F22C9